MATSIMTTPSFYSTSTVHVSNASAASEIQTSATQTPLASSTNDKGSSNGLGRGAKVGLGVGFGLGGPLLILLVASLFFFRRRKRQRRLQMAPKHTPHAQSELSMVDSTYPFPAGPPRSDRQPPDFTVRNSQAYFDPPPPLVGRESFEATMSAVTQKDGYDQPEQRDLQQPLSLLIPGTEAKSLQTGELSPLRNGSPVSPVSPVSTTVPAVNRSLSSRSCQ